MAVCNTCMYASKVVLEEINGLSLTLYSAQKIPKRDELYLLFTFRSVYIPPFGM